ncbi:MAG: glycosyltransferase family 2 protein [Coriobacteriia bacterium]
MTADTTKPVSIIVLTYNGLALTRACFDRLFENTSDFELVVVDNASSDGTVEYLQELARTHGNVRVKYNSKNAGFAGGCNQGVQIASHELICLLNNDTEPLPGWLDALREVVDTKVGAVGSKLLYPDMTIQHAGIVFVYRPGLLPHFSADHRLRGMPSDTPEANVLEEVPAVTAACMLTSKSVWRRARGMDTGFAGAYYEDVDFNLKVRDFGYKVIYQPASVLINKERGTTTALAGTPEDPRQHFDDNQLKYILRWNKRLFQGLHEAG